MSISKVRNTRHVYDRGKERAGLTKKETERLIKQAYISGTSAKNLPDGPIQDELVNKEICNKKRIKVYQGYVFIFCKNSTRCITMYPLKEELIERQKEYERTQ